MFDTNVVVSALVFGGRLRWLRQAWVGHACIPVVCRETVDELLRVLAYPKFKLAASDRAALLQDYLPPADIISLTFPLQSMPVACRDRDDTIFLALAQCAGVPLVSGDADLTVLRTIAPIDILSAAELRARLPAV